MLHLSRKNAIGHVRAIYLSAPTESGPMPMGGHSSVNEPISVLSAEVVSGMGLRGDRWFGVNALRRSDGVMVPNNHVRNVSFFEEEVFNELLAKGFPITYPDIRRNIMVKGFPLNDMVGREFVVGSVRFLGTRLSHGCDRIEKLLGIKGINKALYMRGGIRAEALTDGVIRVGDQIRVADKVALVTGAKSFLGSSIVQKLSADFIVLETGTKPVDSPNYFQADLTKELEAESLMTWVLQKHSRIDCLVCCAGGNTPPQQDDAVNVSADDVDDVFRRNVITAMNCCRYCVPHMKAGCHICFIGSQVVGNPRRGGRLTSYGLSKAALHEYTLHLSNQLNDKRIFVNCVAPGTISPENNAHPNRNDLCNAVYQACFSKATGAIIAV